MKKFYLLLLAAVFLFWITSQSAKAQDETTITHLNYYLDTYAGQTVQVHGYLNIMPDKIELWETMGDMMINDRYNWDRHVVLSRDNLPADVDDYQNYYVRVKGLVKKAEYEYAFAGPGLETGYIIADEFEVISKGIMPKHGDGRQGNSDKILNGVCDSCKFALIFCGYRQADYWNDVKQKYNYKKDKHKVCPDHLVVLFKGGTFNAGDVPNGTKDADGNLTGGGAFDCTKDNFNKAFEYIKKKMKDLNCEPAEFQFHTTGHGGGYHSAYGTRPNTAARPNDSLPRGYSGGKIDDEGEETQNKVNENDMIFWSRGTFDTNGDGRADIKVEMVQDPRDPANRIKKVTQDKDGDGTFETVIGHDFNGDDRVSKADSAWTAPDLNKNNRVDDIGWEDTMQISGGEFITDDDLVGKIQELIDSTGLNKENSRAELSQCYSGSFLDDLRGVTTEASSACARNEPSWSYRGNNGYNLYQKFFIDSLAAGNTWSDAHRAARDSAQKLLDREKKKMTGQYMDNSGECIEMIGPYEKDGKICIRIRNICGQTVTVRPKLITHDFGIQSSRVAEESFGPIELKNGEWKEFCVDKPSTPGNFCFQGFCSVWEPQTQRKHGWLNNITVQARTEDNEASVNMTVGGNEEFDANFVYLEPIEINIPEGWEYQLSKQEINIDNFQPVEVEVKFFYPPDVKPGDEAELKIQGWAESGEPDAGHVNIKVKIIEDVPGYVISTKPGWNLSSLPAMPEVPLVNELFPDADAVFGFNQDAGYYPLEFFEEPQGFWLSNQEGGDYIIQGAPIESQFKELAQGWHLVGGIAERPAMIIPEGTCEIAAQFAFNAEQGYYPSEIINSGESVWVNLPNDCVFRVVPVEGRKSPGMLAASLWETMIYAQGEQDGNKVNVSSVVLGADEMVEITTPAPPAPPEYTTDIRLYRFDGDGKPVQPSHYKDVQMISGGQTDTLRWLLQVDPNGNDPFQSRTSVLSWDPTVLDGGKENEQWLISSGMTPSGIGTSPQDMKANSSLQVSGTDAKFYTITYIYAEASSVEEQNTPEILSIGDAVPNPFNSSIDIFYTLTEPSNLTAVIYNSYGREVWRFDAGMQSGNGKITWQGESRFGTSVSSGSYYIQLNAGSKASEVKLLNKAD